MSQGHFEQDSAEPCHSAQEYLVCLWLPTTTLFVCYPRMMIRTCCSAYDLRPPELLVRCHVMRVVCGDDYGDEFEVGSEGYPALPCLSNHC